MGAINPLKKVYGVFSSSPTTRKLMGKPGQMLNDISSNTRFMKDESMLYADPTPTMIGGTALTGGGIATFGHKDN